MEETRYCDFCGAELNEDEETWVGDELLCDDCVDERCTVCDYCGDTIWLNDAEQDNDTTLCCNCFNSHYRRCECCDRIIHDDDINWHNDYPYCDNCFDDFDDEIKEYHPMTLDYHMNEMDWESVLHETVNMGYRSHHRATAFTNQKMPIKF